MQALNPTAKPMPFRTNSTSEKQNITSAALTKGNAKTATAQLKDNRPEASLQRRIQSLADQSPRTQSPLIQRMEEEELLQGKAMQRMEEEELLQGKAIQQQEKKNKTGLPDQLKSGVESLSGQSLDDVNVHFNSAKPAMVQAHAYAQGSDIHLAPGQERHLPHEAWHVAQQKQGRVQPTIQAHGVAINDNPGLEKEADVMGAKAAQMRAKKP